MPRSRTWVVVASLSASVGVSILIIGTAVTEGLGTGNDLAGIVAAVATLIPLAWTVISATRSGADTEDPAELLAAAVSEQWEKAARERGLVRPHPLPVWWRRSKSPVAGPVTAATETTPSGARFDPLPGLDTVDREHLEEGDAAALHTVYGGLASGRLLLLGPAGSGKSSAAILLLCEALRFREHAPEGDRARIPVPVMFTLHGWTHETAVTDWLTDKLVENYPMFRGRREHAAKLLVTGRVAVFLDGLDEMPEYLRSSALTALADAPFRLVITSRIDEALTTAKTTILTGAVALEIQPVPSDTAAKYLLEPLVDPPPPSWKVLVEHLTGSSDSAVGDALDNPLTLSLLRDVYGATEPVDELLDTTRFPTSTDIDNHLLDHAIHAAYRLRPGRPPPPYTAEAAHRTLRYLASRMTAAGTRDLAWWQLPRLASENPTAATPLSPKQLRLAPSALRYGLMHGLPAGPATGLAIWLKTGPTAGLVALVTALAVGLIGGGLFGLVLGLVSSAQDSKEVEREVRGPVEIWVQDRRAGLTYGITMGLAGSLSTGLLTGYTVGFAAGATVGIVVGLGLGTLTTFSGFASSSTTASFARLSIAHRTPPRMILFLEDARARNLLRTVGPLYQFRHAEIQDRLASTSTEQPAREAGAPD
ncbi:hypothetical protein FHR84_003497 [Actinopolyspora biskrensis]|uniref:NACHT domain-containing protein n=1 Tax=Actinopolyspora biskrensis TaxID=1470178 RepID=A0A852Z0X4_9ACTN|nr:hypothetical protein [Actinopolyspora biskrensis]NYH80148.1 hypothetical protein [Actinopolyspora biskrensis]